VPGEKDLHNLLVIVSFGYLPSMTARYGAEETEEMRRDEICPLGPDPCGASRGWQDQNRRRDDNAYFIVTVKLYAIRL